MFPIIIAKTTQAKVIAPVTAPHISSIRAVFAFFSIVIVSPLDSASCAC